MNTQNVKQLSILVMSLFLCGPAAWAATLESNLIHKLILARQASEVSAHLKKLTSFKQSELACRMQIRQNAIPTECYSLLAIEKSALSKPKAHWKKLEDALDKLCIKNGQLELRKEAPTIPHENSNISQSCQDQLVLIRSYKDYQKHANGWSEN